MQRSSLIAILLLSISLHLACTNLPRDPNETLRQLQSRPMRVGIVERSPWVVRTSGEPAGVEADLLRNFASQLGTTIEWHSDNEQEQLEALEHYQLDVVIGGLTDRTPWRKYVGLTSPYFEETYRVGIPASSQLQKLDGAAAVALLGFGLYILIHAAMTLVMVEKPTIQTMEIFGRRVWLGWVMIAALVYSVIPPFILGRIKKPLAHELHQKALQTDANMNKGDWLAGLAGILGIAGVAYGYWWADAVAAIIISLEILRDGVSDLSHSVAQLMNKRPSDVDENPDPTPDKLQHELEQLEWVQKARVRLREDGDVLTGEAFVVPRDEVDLLNRLSKAREVAHAVDWRLHDVQIVPVRSLE